MYVGETERAVRQLFQRARNASPSIIFFDEFDSLARRNDGGGKSSPASSGGVNTLTALLTEMSGFETLTGVIIIAATNRPDILDPAMLRSGRFDHHVYVGLPNQVEREAVFNIHLRGHKLSPDVDISSLATRTEGHSGSEIKSICAGSLELAVDRELDGGPEYEVTQDDLLATMAKVPRIVDDTQLKVFRDWEKRRQSMNGKQRHRGGDM